MQDDSVVITVVYDGPPQAGKTTSVRALARAFGREVYTPEERDGRTVFFDWLEHVGGRFEGAPIRCQIVSVPGQKRWTRRRGHFLERADVVVFVGDTTAGGWPETVARLADLRADLDGRVGPPVGLVFQANKRDCADAVPMDEIRGRAANARTAVVESTASDGSGVREAFVFAVRLALDRVRADLERGGAGTRRGLAVTGTELVDLVALLRSGDAAAEVELPPIPPLPGPAITVTGLRPPSFDAPSGFVWPPIEGRIMLREAAPPLENGVQVAANGDCIAGAGSAWRLHSPAASVFTDIDEARTALLSWVRQHVAAQPVLSRRRCIVLAATGEGRWRLWQIVQQEPTLRDLTSGASRLDGADARRLVGELLAACVNAALPLTCTIDTIGITDLRQPVYVGLMPSPGGP
ncbi:MAG: GTPase domain-containing protein [Deltaproteobacteria bacterium]|nr:GTPase domain-containing protein [Deltaproteobacteria bacterium]